MNNNIQITFISDKDLIKTYTGRVISAKTLNLKFNKPQPETGGLYDYKIFGKKDFCECGKLYHKDTKCPICGIEVYKKDKDLKDKKALYEMPIVYVHKASSIFAKSEIDLLKCWSSYLDLTKEGQEVDFKIKGKNYSWQPATEKTKLEVLGLNGLYNLISESKSELNQGMSKYLVITNPIVRKFGLAYLDRTKIEYPIQSSQYATIINSCKILTERWNDLSIEDRAGLILGINMIIWQIESGNEIINSGGMAKEGMIRRIAQTRVSRSLQSGIIGDNDIKVNEIIVPKALLKHSLQFEIIKRITTDTDLNYKEACEEYKNEGEEFQKIFKELTTNLKGIFTRHPGLYRRNSQGVKILVDEDESAKAIHIANLIQKSYNADIDGDKMQVIILPGYVGDMMYDKLSIDSDWRKDKNDEFIFEFDDMYLAGLYYATRKVLKDEIKEYSSFNDLEEDFNNDNIWVSDVINLNGKNTTYGIEKMSKLLGKDLGKVIEGETITSDNVYDLMEYLEGQLAGLDMVRDIQKFAADIATYEGISTLTVKDYTKLQEGLGDIAEDVNKIEGSNFEKQKVLNRKVREHLKKKTEEIPNLKSLLDSNAGVSYQSITNMIFPKIVLNKNNELVVDHSSNLIEGMDITNNIQAAIQGRQFNIAKQESVPKSGWMTSQLSLALNDYKYNTKEKNVATYIELEEKYLEGRITLDGNLIKKTNSDKLVKVQSIVGSKSSIVYRNMVHKDYNEDSYIGINFATAFTEGVTQSSLSLKHSKNKGQDLWRVIENLETKEIKIDDKNGQIYTIGGKKYLITLSSIMNEKDKFSPGDIIAIHNSSQGLDFILKRIVSLIGSQTTRGQVLFKGSMNRTLSGGIISYTNDTIRVGKEEYPIDQNELYFYPQGYKLKPFESFSSGFINIREYISLYGKNAFPLFYHEILEIIGKTVPEIVEPMFNELLNYGKMTTKLDNLSTLTRIGAKNKESSLLEDVASGEIQKLDLYSQFVLGIDLIDK